MERLKTFVVKSVDDESADYHFEGYASTFENKDRDGDIMAKGCFDETVKIKATVPICLNHNRNVVLGMQELSIDSKGLRTRGTFNLNDPEAQKWRDLMKMGAIDSFSIGFMVKDYERLDPANPFSGLLFKEVEVVEVSIVTVPANPNATVETIKSFNADEVAKHICQANMKQAIMEKLAKI